LNDVSLKTLRLDQAETLKAGASVEVIAYRLGFREKSE
jgi:hypothetical protein